TLKILTSVSSCFSLRSTYLRDLDLYQVRYVFTKALEVWSKHSRLTFTEVNSDRADILVYFHTYEHGDNFAFDGKGQILAHAFFPGSGRGGDAHFDLDESWIVHEDDASDGTSLFHVAAHEFGHSLGLSHSSVEGALMFPWYQGMQNGFNYELPEDDRLGIQTLYGSPTDQVWGHNPAYHPPLQTPPPPTRPPPRPTPPPTRTRPTRRTTRPNHNYPNYPQRPYYPEKPQDPRYPKKTFTEKPMHKKPMSPDVKYPYNPHRNRNYPPKPPPRPELPDERYYPAKRPETTTYSSRHPQRYPVDNYPSYNPKESSVPNTCDTGYDAISVVRGEVFIFKDRYFWRISDKGLAPGYPVETNRMWKDLPKNLTHIDAVYERPDNKMVFFVGRNYYVYSGNTMERDYPKPLTRLGLPASLSNLDAAMVWGHNGKTYFFSGNMYWR
ncbi:matrix metalloproteinase-2-like, partial [Photinus pyralis]|uniref:matrix metalloproteinase-2-like n=1 Tax=Photinus pyralis TaxID=7054 RepID=UPI001266E84A